MKISEQLRAGARYMSEHGFDPDYRRDTVSECGCFIHALDHVSRSGYVDDETTDFMVSVIFDGNEAGLTEPFLRREGWNTDDAVAAMEIAADYAEASGK